MSEPRSTTIPLLPCVSLDDSLAFWRALQFDVALTQRAPNPYAVIRYSDFELHLFGLKPLKPEANFTTCLVIVPEVERLHEAFAGRLKESFGRVPYRGLPRLSRMRPSQTRFTVTDVAGNSVIFIKRGPEDDAAAAAYQQAGRTPLQRAVAVATRERDFKGDDDGAARVLDTALERHRAEASLDYARALMARIELATVRGEEELADDLYARLKGLSLDEAGAEQSRLEADALDGLRRSITQNGNPRLPGAS